MSGEDNNSYGVHLLVDFKPIEEADLLLVECDRYIEESKQEMFVLPFMPAFSLIASNVRAWRNKRRDSRLMSVFSVLQPKIVNTEKTLRRILGEVVEKKIALRMQATHLQARLEACIAHNKELIRDSDKPLDETRHYVEMLSNESKLLKDMVIFNKEILRMQAIEKHQKAPAQRWGHQHRRGGGTVIGDVEMANDPEHKVIEERLVKFREMRESFVQLLGVILEKRGVQQSNIDNCSWSLESLRGATKRDGVPTVLSAGNLFDPDQDHDPDQQEDVPSSSAASPGPAPGASPAAPAFDRVPTFDHSRCADCSYGYAMACDCMNHLSALQKQANEASSRLQLLVEARERMLEANDLMAQLDQNPELRNTLLANNGTIPPPHLSNTNNNTSNNTSSSSQGDTNTNTNSSSNSSSGNTGTGTSGTPPVPPSPPTTTSSTSTNSNSNSNTKNKSSTSSNTSSNTGSSSQRSSSKSPVKSRTDPSSSASPTPTASTATATSTKAESKEQLAKAIAVDF